MAGTTPHTFALCAYAAGGRSSADDHAIYTILLSARTDAMAMSDSSRGPMVSSTIAPLLSVRRGARAVEFYKAAFGAIEMHRVDSDSGEVVARLSVNGAEFWVADESPAHRHFSPESLGGSTTRLVLDARR
jgi:hypothetical protein